MRAPGDRLLQVIELDATLLEADHAVPCLPVTGDLFAEGLIARLRQE